MQGRSRRRLVSLSVVSALAAGAAWYAFAPASPKAPAGAGTPHASAAPAAAAPATAPSLAAGPTTAPGGAVASFEHDVKPILQTYCFDCHGNGAKNGNVSFDTLLTDAQVVNPALWLKVLKNTRARIMPPAGEPVPTAAEQAQLEHWIKTTAFGADPQNPDPGRVTLRRLNRNEYHNAIRDLIGLDFDTATAFPPDDVGYGFDNIGDVLNISPLRLEKFIEAAINVVDQGVPKDTVAITSRPGIGEEFLGEDGPSADLMNFYKASTASKTFQIEKPGDYKFWFQVKIDGDTTFDPQECRIHVKADGKEVFTDKYVYADVKYFDNEVQVHWEPGPHKISFTTEPVHPELQPLRSKMQYRLATYKLDGPLDRKLWEHPSGFHNIYTRDVPPPAEDIAGRRAYAVEVLGRFATRAFRRPVDPDTLKALVDIAEKTYSVPGTPFEAGIAQAIVGILASPQFLFHVEQVETAADQKYPRLDEYSLAERLSFTLWCSIPDEELTKLAAAGQLRKNLTAQVNRMLADPKSAAFVEAFSNQWLQTRVVLDIPINSAVVMAAETGAPAVAVADAGGGRGAFAGAFAGPGAGAAVDPAAGGAAPNGFAGRGGRGGAGRGAGRGAPPEAIAGAGAAPEAAPGGIPGQGAAAAVPPGGAAGRGAGAFGGAAAAGRGAAGRGAAGAGRGGARGGRGGRGGPVFTGTELTPEVRTAMKQEVEAYFAYVMRENRSVLDFLQSNYTFVNAALAPVYGIPNITGLEMRKVDIPPNDPRGGVITMGSVLTVTSNPTRTSPVKRGKWILENLLGSPPAPPPPNVPALEETITKAVDRHPTQREALALHRENPLCASCHMRMDPPGLALENFNAFGRFRTTEFAQPIDPATELATGEKVAGVLDLKKALVTQHRQEFYHTLTEKLLTYALGRGIEYYDVDTVDRIVDRLNKDDGHFSTLLMGVIESAPFQQRRPTATDGKVQTASSKGD